MFNYKIYPSILDKFESYVNSSRVYNQYYGFSEEPSVSDEEFEKKKFQELIDGINRVPTLWEDSEKKDKGTAFNEVVDCLIENRTSEKMNIKSIKELGIIEANFNNRVFNFPFDICKEFAEYFKGALTQQYTESELQTKYGTVLLYGYIDELLPFKVADIKTTSKYNAYKYRNSLQRIVYPYCLNQNNIKVTDFEFAVTDFKNTWTELYQYNPDKDIPALVEHCEAFIELLEANKNLITDKKIFGLI